MIYLTVNILKALQAVSKFEYTGGPRHIREIGTQKVGSQIMNSHIKRPRITLNLRIGSRKTAISQSHVCKIADKKVTYNEGRLYFKNRKRLEE